VTTKRNLTCQFPFFNNRIEFGECIPTGPNEESCWCGTHAGIEVSDKNADRISRGQINPLTMDKDEIANRTKWDFCRCSHPVRNHPIYTTRNHPKVSMP